MQEAQISASLSAESGPRAGEILFSWEVQGLTCTSKDWIGLYIHNRQYCNKYSAYFLTNGEARGSGSFSRVCEGHYDLRLFLHGDNAVVASTASGCTPACRTNAVVVGTPVAVQACLAGRSVVVSWPTEQASSHPLSDWVGLFSAVTLSNRQFITFKYCTAAGTVALPAPCAPGAYEVRYFKHGSSYAYAGRSDLVVVPNSDHVQVRPSRLTQGQQEFEVAWTLSTAEPSSRDWVGLFCHGVPNGRYLACWYTCKGACEALDDFGHAHGALHVCGDVVQTLAPGNYDLRLFAAARGTYQDLASAFLVVAE
eukprot:TRINITY_DN2831_c0_g1_i7.p1 TRINITY_DN2831_c0_g1~~TRINITY_DN2831_c0_g1_i7.p1  ORF type:complete len:310 (-),score=44.10 TRINITY_DN2831_c0_g1_i7:31-960(-)